MFCILLGTQELSESKQQEEVQDVQFEYTRYLE